MSNSNLMAGKRRGRPRTGQTPVLSFRMDLNIQDEIDHWRRQQRGNPSRSKAIRGLILRGLRVVYEEIEPEVQDEIDDWRRLEPDNPSRSSAIHCLILMGIRLAQDERKREDTKKK
jgi:hypothetical protein